MDHNGRQDSSDACLTRPDLTDLSLAGTLVTPVLPGLSLAGDLLPGTLVSLRQEFRGACTARSVGAAAPVMSAISTTAVTIASSSAVSSVTCGRAVKSRDHSHYLLYARFLCQWPRCVYPAD